MTNRIMLEVNVNLGPTKQELKLSISQLKHDIQYFERVGSTQNNIGHLDT